LQFSKDVLLMNPLVPGLSTLAVAAIYCIWCSYQQFLVRQTDDLRQRTVLHQRVAWMLWVMATEEDEEFAA
jgi:hypothetical protein